MLAMVSMGAWAQIDVQIANDGKFDGGTIEVTDQKTLDDGVEVTITVTPKDGYTIKKNAITVVSTYPPSGSRADTRTPEIAETLTLYFKGSADADTDDLSAERDYTFNVPTGFGAWVQDAIFQSSGKKGGDNRNTESVDLGYSGTYYIGTAGYNASTPDNNYYLCPTEGWIYYKPTNEWSADGTTYPNPFLTTFKCKTAAYSDVNNAVWYVEKHPSQNYYYIRHAIDGKYLMANGQISGTGNANRMRVHLEEVSGEPDDMALFSIEPYPTNNPTYLVISPKSSAGWNGNYKWFTVNNGNKDYLVGNESNGGPTGYAATGGIIGLYSQNDGNAKFYLEKATIDPPTITNNFDGTVTITAETGATIYYTIDGTTPTTSTSTSGTTSVTVTITESSEVVKAIAKGSADYFPTIVTTYKLPQCLKPVITVTDGTVTISCATDGATIRYTTDDTEATLESSNTYSAPFSIGSAAAIRAIASKVGYAKSEEAYFIDFVTISSSIEIRNMRGMYRLAEGFSSTSAIGTSLEPFCGVIDGQYNTISGLDHPLVAYADGATIKNVILSSVNITSGTNVGAICNEATGTTRIYNCGVVLAMSEGWWGLSAAVQKCAW